DAPASVVPGAAAGVEARPTRGFPADRGGRDTEPRAGAAELPAARAALTASVPAPAAPAAPARAAAPADPGVLQEAATVPVTNPHAQVHTPATSLRGDTPVVPGAPVPLHGGALQDRIDTALRWMAGGGLHTAQLRVDPDALGPITIHLRLDGDVASVVFGSNHEQTRQALEDSLSGLKEALSAGGLNLGQA